MLDFLHAYENYLKKVRQASDNTVSSYLRDIKQFCLWLESESFDVLGVTHDDFLLYLEQIQHQGKSSATASRILASLKSFYAYLVSTGFMEQSPIKDELHIKRGSKKSPQILSSEEIHLLMQQASGSDFKSIRDRAMLELMYATGIRVSELIGLNLDDVDLKNSFIRCGKEKKMRLIPIYPKTNTSITNYLQGARNQLLQESESAALFVNTSGTRMSRQGFWKILKTYQVKAGIQKEITPHTLRHSFAVHALESGAEINALQVQMGHRDISSTQTYADMLQQKDPNECK